MATAPDCRSPGAEQKGTPPTTLDKALRVFSVLTLLFTVPQVWQVWHGRAEGVSLVSWATYLASACLWMAHGLRKHDKAIYVPCIGWILLDGAIVAGILVHL